MARPLMLLATLPLLCSLLACSGRVDANPGAGLKPAARMTPTPQAASLTATRDQGFTVVLEGLASAGYEWALQEGYDTRVVRPRGAKRYGELGANPLPGSSATEIFDFEALAAGQTTLIFVNKRPWEAPSREDETRRFSVTVR